MEGTFEVPRCEHGFFVLGCPKQDCALQNKWLERQNAQIERWNHIQEQAARDFVRGMYDNERT